jgi:hypothetical protein
MDEIKRLKAQHEEMLLKHAREQGVALSALETALKEIERLKAILRRAANALDNGDLAILDEMRKAAE